MEEISSSQTNAIVDRLARGIAPISRRLLDWTRANRAGLLITAFLAGGTALLYYTIRSSKSLHDELTEELAKRESYGSDIITF